MCERAPIYDYSFCSGLKNRISNTSLVSLTKIFRPQFPQVRRRSEQQALDKIKARRSRLNLDAIGIKAGDVLTLSRDESVTGIVVDGGKLLFDGEVMSLSAAALKALHAMGYKTPAASGPGYWMFDGELLGERRLRLEAEQYGTAGESV